MKLRKRISLLLAVVLTLTALPAGFSVQAADAVAINSDNFTDHGTIEPCSCGIVYCLVKIIMSMPLDKL